MLDNTYTLPNDRKVHRDAITYRIVSFEPSPPDAEGTPLPFRAKRNDAIAYPDGSVRVEGPDGHVTLPGGPSGLPASRERVQTLARIARTAVGSWR